jgi:hypothetical protein
MKQTNTSLKVLSALSVVAIAASCAAQVFAFHLPIPTQAECEAQGNKMTICHATSSSTNPYEEITIACEALYGKNDNAGHFDENGTPHSGHEDDFIPHDGATCPAPATSPSPTPSSSPDPSTTPTPSSTPTPTSSPTSGSSGGGNGGGGSSDPGKQTSLANDNLQCHNPQFDAVMDVKENGNGIKDVLVTFVFNGQTKQAHTNEHGRAKVTFDRAAGTITATANGYPSQSMNINVPSCHDVVLDPDRSKVLGATTLADTGSSSEFALSIGMLAGLSLAALSTYGYLKTSQG